MKHCQGELEGHLNLGAFSTILFSQSSNHESAPDRKP